MQVRPKKGRAAPFLMGLLRFLAVAVTTYLGLLAVTFFIGRVIPIDPALAIAGDHAPRKCWSACVVRCISTNLSTCSSTIT